MALQTATLLSCAPVFPALDIQETVEFYRDRLGFRIVQVYPDEGYGIVERGGYQIHFWQCDDQFLPEVTSCYIYVAGIDALYAEYKAHGVVHPQGELTVHPWGQKNLWRKT